MFPAPEIFVLVPSYNHAQFVERCLQSIIKQTLKPTRLLVIDDGSSDDSPQVIKRVLADCPFPAEFAARQNRGLCRTLNEGFEKSVGCKYFAYLGSDDIWLPQFLASRIKLLEARPNAALAFGNAFLIDENDKIIDCTKDWGSFVDGDALPMLLRPAIPPSPSVVYRRADLEEYRWNENSILEDYEIYLKLSKKNEFAFDETVLCAWRQHGWNTSADFSRMMHEWLAAQSRNAAFLGLSSNDLAQTQAKTRFACVADFIRRGQKREAWRMLIENRSSASPLRFGKTLFRFLIPSVVWRWHKERQKVEAARKYGEIIV